MTFKIGDKVQVVNDHSMWIRSEHEHESDVILAVVEDHDDDAYCVSRYQPEILLKDVNEFPTDFKLVFSESAPVFQIGDEIKCVSADPNNWYNDGEVYTVRGEPFKSWIEGEDRLVVHVKEQPQNTVWVVCDQFELVPKKELPNVVNITVNRNDPVDPKFAEEISQFVDEKFHKALGVHRPVLETRKADKIRMELFDDGFPNAVLEIAKVMTWAQKAKGYKDHDWQNLPNPENSLKGAASRHRNDANRQKMKGVPAAERVDHESNLHHLAHQAFNILAELELILTGKIV